MKNNPAIFLKLLVLLVPREMKVEHSGAVKAMSDEQLEAGIEAITAMLEARLPGDRAKVVDGEVMPDAPALPGPRKARRKVGRDDNNVGMDVGTDRLRHAATKAQAGQGNAVPHPHETPHPPMPNDDFYSRSPPETPRVFLLRGFADTGEALALGWGTWVYRR
jgi:hypothetical protein